MAGKDLEELRRSYGWTARYVERLSRIAARVDGLSRAFSRTYLRQCELDKVRPDAATLRTLAIVYRRTMQELAQLLGLDPNSYSAARLPGIGQIAELEIYRQGNVYSVHALLKHTFDLRRSRYFQHWQDMFVEPDGILTGHLKNVTWPVFYVARNRFDARFAPYSFVVLDAASINADARRADQGAVYVVELHTKEGSTYVACQWGNPQNGQSGRLAPAYPAAYPRPKHLEGNILGRCAEILMRVVRVNGRPYQEIPRAQSPAAGNATRSE